MISIDLNLVWNVINLIVLYLLLRHFLFMPVMNIMEKREKMIADGLKSAQDARDEADRMKQEYESALSGAMQESVQIIEDARRSAKAEYDRIVGEAGDRAGNMLESAKETVRIEREQAMKELQTQIAGLAALSAAKIVGGNTGAGDDQELYDQFLKETGEDHEDADR